MDSAYEIQHEIGCGTYGRVYKALQNSTHVAIKRDKYSVYNNTDDHPGVSQSTIREINVIAHLQHDNIITSAGRVHTQHSDTGVGVFVNQVLEYVPLTLVEYLQIHEKKFESSAEYHVEFVNTTMNGIMKGLHHMHTSGWLHRDVKINNVVIYPDTPSVVKLIDFGSSIYSAFRPHACARMLSGNSVQTRTYRAPELELKSTAYGPEVDIWSAGMLMLELCKVRVNTTQPLELFNIPKEHYNVNHAVLLHRPAYKSPSGFVPERLVAVDPTIREKISQVLEFFPDRRITAAEYLHTHATTANGIAFLDSAEKIPLDNFYQIPHSFRCVVKWIMDLMSSSVLPNKKSQIYILQSTMRMFNHYTHIIGLTYEKCDSDNCLRNRIQVILACCAAIQAKLHFDRSYVDYKNISYFGCDVGSPSAHVETELHILSTLDYDCFYPTPMEYFNAFLADEGRDADVIHTAKVISIQIMHSPELARIPCKELSEKIYTAASILRAPGTPGTPDSSDIVVRSILRTYRKDPLIQGEKNDIQEFMDNIT
jgi:serine/threonine protein kinase